jgi:aminoglycoside 6'-N-acetyltransferase
MIASRMPPEEITFRPVEETDFSKLTAWLAEPHVRRFYQKTPITLAEVAAEYGPTVRGEEPSICHLAVRGIAPFAYLQCYLNADYPEWAEMIQTNDGVSVDLYIGDPAFLRKGFGRAALSAYMVKIAFPSYAQEKRVYIAHELTNETALRCSKAAGFQPLRTFLENGIQTMLLVSERS